MRKEEPNLLGQELLGHLALEGPEVGHRIPPDVGMGGGDNKPRRTFRRGDDVPGAEGDKQRTPGSSALRGFVADR